MCGEKADAYKNVIKDWELMLFSLIEGFRDRRFPTQLKQDCFMTFNPTNCFVIKMKILQQEKRRIRIMIFFTVNAEETDKLKPFLIGRAAKL